MRRFLAELDQDQHDLRRQWAPGVTSGPALAQPAAQPPIVSHWNLAEHLHPRLREYFTLMVGEFIDHLHRHAELHRSLKQLKDCLQS